MVVVRWSNGETNIARTWDELLEIVRLKQWSYHPPEWWRDRLAHRASVWSGRPPPSTEGTAAEFGRRLAGYQMFQIVEDKEEPC